jgi:hypothetical protein
MMQARKILPLEKALDIAMETARQLDAKLTPREEKMAELVVRSCPPIMLNDGQFCMLDDLKGFVSNLQKAILTKDSSFLLQRRGLCVNRVADIEEFCESYEYMGQKGYVRPKVMEGLIELFTGDTYVECVLSGSIGWGKTYFSEMAEAYMLYLLSCYHNPQAEFDMAPGSSIIFIQQSKTYQLAKKVVFEQFSERLRQSPYFKKNFSFDPQVKSELRFPKNISVLPVGGSDTAALGMNVFGGIIDEMNFMARIKGSVEVQHTHEEEYDQAERLYTTLIRRMKSRFMQKGRLPGKLLLVSSVNYPKDFTSRKIEEAKTDETILAIAHSQWEVLPPDRFSGETFPVEVGNEVKQSRVLLPGEEATDPEDVIQVPVEYKTEFERDLEAALRDLAGITAGTRHSFIPYRDLLQKATEEHAKITSGRSLFLYDDVVLTKVIDPVAPDWGRLVSTEYLEKAIVDRAQPFVLHIDVAVTQDCCGVAVGRILGYKLLPSTKYYNERMKEFVEIRDIRAPIYMIDGVLRIMPPRGGGEIDLELVRDLVLWLRGEIYLRWGTCDSYQSTMLLQAMRKARIKCGVLSVDQSMAPYTEVKLAVKDERLLFPYHEMLLKELRELERDPEKDKVDHPTGGSKDCSDAVAGVVYVLQQKEASYGRPVSARRRLSGSDESAVRKVRMGGKYRRRRG